MPEFRASIRLIPTNLNQNNPLKKINKFAENAISSGRNARQKELIPPEALERCHVVVIGVGSVGRQVAIQLAAIGVPAMTLIDPDIVSEENLGCQGFWETDVGDPKVHAVANVCHQQFPQMELHARQERFRKSTVNAWPQNRIHAAFICVDSIESRKLIWEGICRVTGFAADGRMAAEVIRVLASDHPAIDEYYPTTLFTAREAYQGSCTAKSTIYSANIAAGLMLGQFTRWLRGIPLLCDQTFNLFAAELSVQESR